jgi:hypothetical protein
MEVPTMELYIDLSKGINTAQLVKKPVQVHGKMGKMFTRMQWVDPKTGQPVHEEHGGKEDAHHDLVHNKMDRFDKLGVAQKLVNEKEHKAHTNQFLDATGYKGARGEGILDQGKMRDHIAQHLDKMPISRIKPHVPAHLKQHMVDYAEQEQPKTGGTPLGLKHTDHSLSEDEVKKRHGEIGDLDTSKLTEGKAVWMNNTFKQGFRMAKTSMQAEFGKRPEQIWDDTLRGTTQQGLEHVFSHPNGDYTATMIDASMFPDEDGDGEVMPLCEMGFHLHDKDGTKLAEMNRQVARKKDGTLYVKNDYLQLEPHAQGKALADTIYKRSEQFWRHLSNGHPMSVNLEANISIGVYAWAKKGFDFSSPKELKKAKAELKMFCHDNKIDLKDVLEKSGHKSIDDLQHSWDFATLDNGKKYNLSSVAPPMYDDIKGEGHFGKAFMIGGKDVWKGSKMLNADTPHEKIHDIHEKHKGGK